MVTSPPRSHPNRTKTVADIARELGEDLANIRFDPVERQVVLKWGGYDYHIEADRIDTPEKLLRWLIHLFGKTWMTTRRATILAETCAKIFGYQIRGL